MSRITYRDTVNYFNIILDDNIKKTVCRLYFNRSQKYISFVDGKGKENKLTCNGVTGVFDFKDQIIARVKEIEENYTKK